VDGAAEAFGRPVPDHAVAADDERYELLAVGARGFRPPALLSRAPVGDPDPGVDPAAALPPVEHPGLRRTFALVYRQLIETSPRLVDPYAIYLLGVDPPPEATEGELAEFDRFYSEVHLPEVAGRRHALRALRYELVSEERPAYPRTPRFLAVYEVDQESAENRRHQGPTYTPGPPVWQAHTTPWRLWYRRLPPSERPVSWRTLQPPGG
jgi:hypothetical protein